MARPAEMPVTNATGRRELWLTCEPCSLTWAAYGPLPAPVDIVAKALKNAKCPSCGGKKNVFVAKEADIVAALAKGDAA